MTDTAEPTQVPPPEEPSMEIHKPHAAKSWKEFFIELGTVVLGIFVVLFTGSHLREDLGLSYRSSRKYAD